MPDYGQMWDSISPPPLIRGNDERAKWLAALISGYDHYPETFGEDWPKVLADSLSCHLWPDDDA